MTEPSGSCASCSKPLVVSLDDVEDTEPVDGSASAERVVPDDVHLLVCGHHFHWLCLLDAYSVTACPACNALIASGDAPGSQKVLCNMRNEGGFQENVDILPELVEEGYLKAYPEERKARAFLHFCRQGDMDAVLGTLEEDEEDEDGDADPLAFDILRYQDQLQEQQSALHCAVISGNTDLAWLLLYLASDLELDRFPDTLLQQAHALGLQRGDTVGNVDLRSLKDLDGKTAEQLAAQIGGPWHSWLGNGRLAMPG